MRKYKITHLTRKWHRYLGLILGIQFFFWTLGGLYFSWTNIDEIRGDDLMSGNPILNFEKENNAFQNINIKLFNDMSAIGPAYIITNFDKEEIETLELTTNE